MKIKITIKQTGQRLDKFLSNKILKISRNQIQKFIKQHKIIVNDKHVTPHYILNTNDEIKIKQDFEALQLASSQAAIKTKKQILSYPKHNQIQYIIDTADYIVLNKPAGLITHGAPSINKITLVDFLLQKYPNIKKVGENPARPGIVHRLDKDVSGLMAIAKTQDCFNSLKEQFQKRKIEKEYTSLVYGKIIKDEDVINFSIRRSKSGHKMAAVPLNPSQAQTNFNFKPTKQAATHFNIIKRFANYTLLKIKIKTGRTHQIRVHLAAYNHPIVGDNLYGTKKTREKNKKLDLKRIFLVADKLSFYDLMDKKQTFKINLPQELKRFIKDL